MNTPETKGNLDTLFEKKEEILATKRLFEIHSPDPSMSPEDILDIEQIIINNFSYLTENGGMTKDEYYQLFKKCEEGKDFTELTLSMYKFMIEHSKKYLEDNPDLSKEWRNIKNPGRDNIEASIRINQDMLQAIEEKKMKGEKLDIMHIGEPPLRERSEWTLLMEEQGISMREAYNLLEKRVNNLDANEITEIQGDIMNNIREIP